MGGKWKTRFSEKAGDERDSVLLLVWYIPELQSVSLIFSVIKNITDAPIRVQKREKEEVYEEAKNSLQRWDLRIRRMHIRISSPEGSSSVYRSHGHVAMKPKMLFF